MATLGFAALNIADITAARSKIVAERMDLRARRDRLRAERVTIAETRSVATIEVEAAARTAWCGDPLACDCWMP